MSITVNTDMITPQILVDAVKGRFRQRTAFMGSMLVSGGACRVVGSMPKGGPGAIGKTIEIPYFGTVGPFVANADGSAITPQKIAQMSETATIARESLAVETSQWAEGVGMVDPALGDPHAEAARQVEEQAVRAIDRLITTEFATTPLVKDVYSATPASAVYFDYDLALDAASEWGDEQDAIVGMVTHSRTRVDMAKIRDSDGRPLLFTGIVDASAPRVTRFADIPLTVSDKVPLTGSTMGTVTSGGTSPPVATLAGTPLGAFRLYIDCQASNASTTTIKFSTDGGNTFSAAITISDDGVPVALTDTAIDSLVGVNGATGLTVAMAAGTFNVDNFWKSKANLKVSSLICQQDAGTFWYNASRLGMKEDTDILADARIGAMHLYHAPKLYRRRRMGGYPGVVKIIHNVRDYVGVVDF